MQLSGNIVHRGTENGPVNIKQTDEIVTLDGP